MAVYVVAARPMLGGALRDILEAIRRAGDGDFSYRPEPGEGDDELAQLAREVGVMCEKLDSARQASQLETAAHYTALDQLRHSDRMSTLQRLASSVAHELGTPLNVIEGRAAMMAAREVSPSDFPRNARIIAEQSARMTRAIHDMVTFARRRPLELAPIGIDTIVRRAIALADPPAKSGGVVIELNESESPIELLVDADRILQLVMNLLMNGIEATPSGGVLAITLRTESRPPREDPEGPESQYACVEVLDQGAGIAEEVLPRLFKPFFTTKGTGGGTGMGLAVAQGIAKDHGGWIDVENRAGRGACFTVLLPKGQFDAQQRSVHR